MPDIPIPPRSHFHFPISFGSIIKLPPNPGVETAYKDLVCTDQDKEKIIELITTLGENNKFSLLLNQTHIRGLGASVTHVHPFKFIVVSMATLELKNCYKLIYEDYFKKTSVLEGMGGSLTREADKKKLEQYVQPFAEEMRVPVESISPFIEARDWEGLVNFLMNT